MNKLFVVATPIGNLKDITLRAIEVLSEVDLILCEDTRVTKKLLDEYNIITRTLSYHSRSGLAKTEKILKLLEEGNSIALVSDAGTPGISDPGTALVALVRQKTPSVAIEVVPGPAAVTAALSIAGIPSNEFTFLGFLPHKKGRQTLFKEIAESERSMIFYESPHRLQKALESLAETLAPGRTVVVAHELTKIHESLLRGTPEELLNHYNEHPDEMRGEFVVLVAP